MAEQTRDEEGFFSSVKTLAQAVRERDDFVVVFHHDADGCAAGAIAIQALRRVGKKVSNICLKQLYKEDIPRIKELGKNYLFVDFGSGQLDYLKDELDEESVFILDHHILLQREGVIPTLKFHTNPMLFGINGGTELSGAGVTFFFALALDEKNFDLSVLAIVGALGDMQDFNLNSELVGMNRKILDIARTHTLVEVKKDLRLYGRVSRPLVSFLMFSTSPVLPGLTANEDNCKAFLLEHSLPLKDSFSEKWLSYNDLPFEKQRELTSALIMLLSENNVPEWKIKELIGEVYSFPRENPASPLSEAKEFATMLNACGRNKRSDIALAVCLGDRKEAYSEAVALMDLHRENLRKGITFIKEKGIEEKESFYFFDAGEIIDESIVGVIAGMLYGSIIQETKPIIAFARNADGTIKVSGRATSELVRKGINLGKAFKEIGLEMEGVEGGGHRIAAGCKVPLEKISDFLEILDKKLKAQFVLSY
jgi:RecJ-like exonuclease